VAVHGPVVLRVCRALLGPTDADDAWSDTFLAAMRAYPQLPPEANLEAWLVRIATNRSIDHHRARGRRPVPTSPLPESPVPDCTDPGSELRDAVADLPERQQLAVALHYLAGLPYAQVAEQIGGSPDAARRAAADGIARLRTLFVPAGGIR
jgi:DNA-directed RNA polymerase specialized sigma24 family protein